MEKLQLLAEKYPNSEVCWKWSSLLAKLEKKPASSPPAVVAKTDAPTADSQPANQLLAAKTPSSGSSSIAASTDHANPLYQVCRYAEPFVSCRLGAWC